MESVFRYTTRPASVGATADRLWSLEYEVVARLSAEEYSERMLHGWRRFGMAMFHPQCQTCQACQALRVDVARFQPNRSQRRAEKLNEGQIELVIGTPRVTRSKLRLYDRFHQFQVGSKGWPRPSPQRRGKLSPIVR